ncbi:hypothetical protein C9374_013421 [Naegleria lovaniensis]|uniref:F-box domain-containing protein n=1 Tax=Naegleria lovaniensis TaxID=51637 RepID=A0AA88H0I9_NAELO|nr:uncharacterized protein C9374_013421 [Naegleria lovaniensis]KAG2391936.1 hypothetical protein C9374_013421 [Naegleria lovaniensis]
MIITTHNPVVYICTPSTCISNINQSFDTSATVLKSYIDRLHSRSGSLDLFLRNLSLQSYGSSVEVKIQSTLSSPTFHFLSELPYELVHQIFLFVDNATLLSVMISCKTLFDITNSSQFWKEKSQHEGLKKGVWDKQLYSLLEGDYCKKYYLNIVARKNCYKVKYSDDKNVIFLREDSTNTNIGFASCAAIYIDASIYSEFSSADIENQDENNIDLLVRLKSTLLKCFTMGIKSVSFLVDVCNCDESQIPHIKHIQNILARLLQNLCRRIGYQKGDHILIINSKTLDGVLHTEDITGTGQTYLKHVIENCRAQYNSSSNFTATVLNVNSITKRENKLRVIAQIALTTGRLNENARFVLYTNSHETCSKIRGQFMKVFPTMDDERIPMINDTSIITSPSHFFKVVTVHFDLFTKDVTLPLRAGCTLQDNNLENEGQPISFTAQLIALGSSLKTEEVVLCSGSSFCFPTKLALKTLIDKRSGRELQENPAIVAKSEAALAKCDILEEADRYCNTALLNAFPSNPTYGRLILNSIPESIRQSNLPIFLKKLLIQEMEPTAVAICKSVERQNKGRFYSDIEIYKPTCVYGVGSQLLCEINDH